jgi:hypothetical protein
MRLGPTDQTTGWPAAVADTWDIDKRKCTQRGTRMGYATRGRFGGLPSKLLEASFTGFEPQNLGGGPDAYGRHMATSVRLLRSEATGEEAWWPSDQKNSSWTIVPVARWFALKNI